MKIKIDNQFDVDAICLAEISFYIYETKKTVEGKTIKKEVFHSKAEIIYCELRKNQFNAIRYCPGSIKNKISSVRIKCVKKVGSRAILDIKNNGR